MQHDQFEQLLIENGEFIFRYLVKLGASRRDAEDIVQDTFYQVLLSYQSIHLSKLKPWLFQVAINRYYDFCRKRGLAVKTRNFPAKDENKRKRPHYTHNVTFSPCEVKFD
ncbi:RNA polymerase sigma factor [Shimazuella kribbensis]|uniref:RNA polymerase sigma factor n=1 Tax=Shimazuella kribbensis TaxID=139808 RepID=UPI0004179AF2|nr:RNA polymerase sigma factor [Shimazuella kribbensis]